MSVWPFGLAGCLAYWQCGWQLDHYACRFFFLANNLTSKASCWLVKASCWPVAWLVSSEFMFQAVSPSFASVCCIYLYSSLYIERNLWAILKGMVLNEVLPGSLSLPFKGTTLSKFWPPSPKLWVWARVASWNICGVGWQCMTGNGDGLGLRILDGSSGVGRRRSWLVLGWCEVGVRVWGWETGGRLGGLELRVRDRVRRGLRELGLTRDGHGRGVVSVGKRVKAGTMGVEEPRTQLPLCSNKKSCSYMGYFWPRNKCSAECTFI